MFSKLAVMELAQSMSAHAAARQSLVAQNIANIDTPGYRAKDLIPFRDIAADPKLMLRSTRDNHLSEPAGSAFPAEVRNSHGTMKPNRNDVSVETEILNTSDIKQQHETAIAVYRSMASILRTSRGGQR